MSKYAEHDKDTLIRLLERRDAERWEREEVASIGYDLTCGVTRRVRFVEDES